MQYIEIIIIWLLFLHWLADFVFQSDYMARNKSNSNKTLLSHCGVYFLFMFLGTGNYLFSLVVSLLHFPVDYITSRITKYLYSKGDLHNFFVIIGLDQFIHIVILILFSRLLA